MLEAQYSNIGFELASNISMQIANVHTNVHHTYRFTRKQTYIVSFPVFSKKA